MSDGQFWILVLFTIITICYLTLILFEELENRKKKYKLICKPSKHYTYWAFNFIISMSSSRIKHVFSKKRKT